jgi:hypothetical protein
VFQQSISWQTKATYDILDNQFPGETMNLRRFAPFCALIVVTLVGVSGAATQSPAAAQPQAIPADAPTRDQVMTLLDLLQVRRSMQQMMAGMKDSLKAGMLQGLKRDVGNLSQKQINKLNLLVDTAFEDIQLEDFIDVMIPVYQRHLSKSDIEEMIRFYSGPTGQKLLREQPQMMQESMQAAQKVQQAKMDSMMDRIERKMKVSDDDAGATKPPEKK